MEKKKLSCNICSKKFANKSNLVRHVRTVHKVKIKKNEKKILCGVCKINFNFYKSFEDHLCETHNFKPEIQRRLFPSKEEFQSYKKNLEESQASFFSTARKVGSKTYYTCHLSGNSKSSKQTGRQQKSGKINATCPARIEIDIKGNWVESFAQVQHFGHSCSVEFLRLRKEDRAVIAAQIDRGVSFDKILKDLKSSDNENLSKRINLIKKKDLHNIAREFNIYKGDRYLSDPARLDKWVSRQNLEENNPILFYKKQGEASDVLNEEDFILVLSTYYLHTTLVSSVKKIVCDSTVGNNNGYQLTALLIINENETGLPLAYCISNKIDEKTMTVFFQIIKESRSDYNAVFMGDDVCYSAWCQVMNCSNERLISRWHLVKTWKEKLESECLVSSEEKEKMLNHCKKLVDAPNTSEFFSQLGEFLNYCSSRKETKLFGEYFMKTYASNLEQWAYSYWSKSGFNTNIYLKSWHRVFKQCYNEGKKCRRVDKCINVLMAFTEDVYEWTIPEIKNKSTFRLTEILEYHKQSLEIAPNCIKKIKKNKWLIKGESSDRPNVIEIVDEHCQCDLQCPHCSICVHRVSCTCLNFLISKNICKHVHACINVPYPLEITSPQKSHPEPESVDILEGESTLDGNSLESRKEDVVKDLQLICDLIDIIPEEVLEEIHKFTSELLPKVVDFSVIELKQPVVEKPKNLSGKTTRIVTPTGDNVLIVEEFIDEGMEDTNETQLCIHTEFDHVY